MTMELTVRQTRTCSSAQMPGTLERVAIGKTHRERTVAGWWGPDCLVHNHRSSRGCRHTPGEGR